MRCSARSPSENEAKAAEPSIASQTEVVDKLKQGLDQMKGKLNELTSKRNELVARSKTAAAQSQVHDALKSIDIMDPTSEVGRFEEKIRREEAKVRGASRNSLPRAWTPSSTRWRTWASRPRSKPGWRR